MTVSVSLPVQPVLVPDHSQLGRGTPLVKIVAVVLPVITLVAPPLVLTVLLTKRSFKVSAVPHTPLPALLIPIVPPIRTVVLAQVVAGRLNRAAQLMDAHQKVRLAEAGVPAQLLQKSPRVAPLLVGHLPAVCLLLLPPLGLGAPAQPVRAKIETQEVARTRKGLHNRRDHCHDGKTRRD